MRYRIILAIAAAAMPAMALSATGARADDEWCGYTAKDNAMIECGYTTSVQCETAVGKGGMCFVDPDYALNVRRIAPDNSTKIPKRG
jgi:hypothetical protein